MADSRPAPLSFRPNSRISRDEEFDERLFDQLSLPPQGGNGPGIEADAGGDEEPPPAREGLPAGFRMRADAHYVDQVVSRRLADPVLLIPVGEIDGPHPMAAAARAHTARPDQRSAGGDLDALVRSVAEFGILQPLMVRRQAGRYELISGAHRLAAAIAAGLSEVPCVVCSADDRKARELADATNLRLQPQAFTDAPALPAAAFAELTEQLGAIDACLHLFGDRERPTRERVGMTLIRTEVRRAAWLAQALAVLTSDAPVARRPLDLAPLVERLAATLAPDRSLTGVTVEAEATSAGVVSGDEQLLGIALAGMVEAVQAAAERCPGARVVSSVHAEDGLVLLETSLSGAELRRPLREAFLDLEAADRPGGARAAIGIKAAGRIAALHGGALAARDEGGTVRLVLSLPAATA